MGVSLKLARTGRLVLRASSAGEEVRLVFGTANGTASSDAVATYIGGQRQTASSDMHCENNVSLCARVWASVHCQTDRQAGRHPAAILL